MPSTHNSHSQARKRAARVDPASDAKTNSESIDSNQSVPSTSGVCTGVPFTQFDLEKTFPAILAPLSLLRGIPESQDIDALRALAPILSHCLDAILHSMAHFPEHIPTSPKYHLALSEVNFSKDMFLGHVTHIPLHDRPSSYREAIQAAMQFLDMTMSSLKGFLNAAAYEVAQLKPLPQVPVEEDLAQNADESVSTDTLNRSQKSKVSALLKPLLKWRPSRLDLATLESAASSTLIHSDSDDPGCGFVYVSVNIRNSLAQFPVSIDPTVGNIPHPEDATELWKDGNGLAQLASLKALVRYMTSPDGDIDVEIIDVFFLCFRFFSSPKETFDTLVARYDDKLVCRSSTITRSHSMQVKMRIARLLYLWVDLHWRAEDAEILNPLTQFAFSRLAQDIPRDASSKLISSLHQRACDGDKSKGLRMEKTIARAEAKHRQEMLSSTWEPREKKSMMSRHAMLALQMTLLLWEKYRAFEPEVAVRYLMTRSGDDHSPTTEIARKVANFMAYERAVHRFVMDSIGSAESVQLRIELTEFFLELASKCHELRNYSASCLIALACDRPTVLPFITKLKLSPAHERMKATLKDFYTRENQHMAGYKQALQSCCCPALPGMMLFIREVARGCGSGPYDQHPNVPESRLINLKRYRPITWAVRAMEKCHAPFKIQRVDYICDWLEHVLSEYLVGTEAEWETRIYDNCRKL
ncbi:ras guanine nucleotide exchange factor domain-containing protein [Boletus reticuloceps]|uniref:Ras guanine nucleotide exchange factor domain-containing protein n=1 Tax=Boletus reticuloceps TaxID=495285 RepID=A0A8I2YRV6_9AGAM|nr:ras guanine nucleotide exchange factor domain-containing protein [Boletus reticuloceps]